MQPPGNNDNMVLETITTSLYQYGSTYILLGMYIVYIAHLYMYIDAHIFTCAPADLTR